MYDRPRKSALREGADLMGHLNSGGPRILAPPPSPAEFFSAPQCSRKLVKLSTCAYSAPENFDFWGKIDQKQPRNQRFFSDFSMSLSFSSSESAPWRPSDAPFGSAPPRDCGVSGGAWTATVLSI